MSRFFVGSSKLPIFTNPVELTFICAVKDVENAIAKTAKYFNVFMAISLLFY
jgi:hypothetical protein